MSEEPDWEDIRRAYANHDLPITKLVAKFGISSTKLYLRVKAEDWPRRPPMIKLKAIADTTEIASESVDPGSAAPPPTAAPPESKKLTPIALRRALVQRLTIAIDTKLKLLERRFEREMHGVEATQKTASSAADFERDTRSIGLLIKNLEQVTDYDDTHQLGKRITGAAAKSASLASTALADEADRIRAELAARLQRFIDTADGGAARISASARTEQAD